MWRSHPSILKAGAVPYTPTQKSLKQHADALALALRVMNPDAPELAEYRSAQQEEWVSASPGLQASGDCAPDPVALAPDSSSPQERVAAQIAVQPLRLQLASDQQQSPGLD